MNFAEAALIIQGSACVYSKKVGSDSFQPLLCMFYLSLNLSDWSVSPDQVEYLHDLVKQMLGLVGSKV